MNDIPQYCIIPEQYYQPRDLTLSFLIYDLHDNPLYGAVVVKWFILSKMILKKRNKRKQKGREIKAPDISRESKSNIQ